MRVLGIETSGEIGALAVTNEREVLSELTFTATLSHSEKLFPAIDQVLALAELDREELQLIAVGLGPGSFTGLRIGVSSAKGLAQALDIPIVGVPSSDGIRERVGSEKSPLWVVIPDRMKWVYATRFGDSDLRAKTYVMELQAFVDVVLESDDKQPCALVAGPAAELHREYFVEAGLRVAAEIYNSTSANEIAWIAERKFASRQVTSDELYSLEPIYLQPAVARAEVKK